MKLRSLTVAVALGLGGCAPVGLGAQGNPDDALTCAQAAQAARIPTGQVPQDRAILRVSRCPQESGDVLPALWRDASLSPQAFGELRQASLRIRDRRLFDGAIAAARDASLPVERRLATLEVLAHYVAPSVGVSLGTLRNPPPDKILPGSTHGEMRAGLQPLALGEESRALDTFKALASESGVPEVQRAARYLRQGFAFLHPELTPLEASAVTGTWECGGTIRLASSADIDLPLTIVDSEGKMARQIELTSPQAVVDPSYPSGQTPGKYVGRVERAGPLTVQLGGRTVLTLACQ
jgi:hypothetical protein